MTDTSDNLLNLAKDQSDGGRTKLAKETANHMLSQPRDFSDQELANFGAIFSQLYSFLDAQTKERLASAMALSDWAPKSLVRAIALDNPNIAGPVISFSPIIDDDDLVEVVKNGTVEHQLRVAERPGIGDNTVGALVDTALLEVVERLGKNPTAEISDFNLKRAMDTARGNISTLHQFLARREISNDVLEFAKTIGVDTTKYEANLKSHNDAKPVNKPQYQKPEKEPITYRANDLFYELTKGHQSSFRHHICESLGIDSNQLDACFKKEKVESFALLARAIGFDTLQLPPMIKALGFGHIWRADFKNAVQAMWDKYTPEMAREQFEKLLNH